MSRTIVITGANRGIGLQAAKKLAAAGHKVILTGRDFAKVQAAAREVKGEVHPYELDVTQHDSIKAFVQKLAGTQVDVLINNAGSIFDEFRMEPRPENPLNTSWDDFNKTMDLNLRGPYILTQALFPLFPQDRRVDIINMSSGLGSLSDMGAGVPAYRISKAGLNALTRLLQQELKDSHFFVNSVCPGWVRTDLGGPNATRSIDESTVGIEYLVNEVPDLRGKFIRDRNETEF